MIYRIKKGAQTEAASARIEELISLIVDESVSDNDLKDAEKELIQLYEKTTGYRAGCGLCVAGRSRFIKGLEQMKSGELKSGSAMIMQSMRTASMKWSRVKDWFNGTSIRS